MVKRYKYINLQGKNEKDILNGKNVIIWGRSISALNLYVKLVTEGITVIGFTDSFTFTRGEFAGMPLYSYEEVLQENNIVIYIATLVRKYQIEILELLEDKEVSVCMNGLVYGPYKFDKVYMQEKIMQASDKIAEIKKLLSDEKSLKTFNNLLNYRLTNDYKLINEVYETSHSQYFPNSDILEPSDNEIFIDAGAYNGATSVEFAKWADNKYNKIYLMEPDPLMQRVAKEYITISGLHGAQIVGKGAYSKSTKLQFECNANSGSSNINEQGKNCIETISIDEMLDGKPATYIKMDIEGAELDALEGAKDTITRYKPKLAISIYHRDDDLWEIPYYILEKYPWYKFYIRHYEPTINETVLYGVV